MGEKTEIFRQMRAGTTQFLILAALNVEDSYGYEISEIIRQRSAGFFDLKQGFLYPALNRMAKLNLVETYWQKSGRGGPNCKYYRITSRGRRHLAVFLKARRDFNVHLDQLLASNHTDLNGDGHQQRPVVHLPPRMNTDAESDTPQENGAHNGHTVADPAARTRSRRAANRVEANPTRSGSTD